MPEDCRWTALNYLKHRMRSMYEVKSRLLDRGFTEEETEEALQYLQEFGYVDDAAFCSYYIRYGSRKGRGPVRLQRELAEKGVEAAVIRHALEEHFDRQTEKDAAMKEARKLLERAASPEAAAGGGPALERGDGSTDERRPDKKTAARIGRRLESLGFHTEIIREIIGKLGKPGASAGES